MDELGRDFTTEDPQVWNFINELRQYQLSEAREVLENIRARDPECYKTLVRTFRELKH